MDELQALREFLATKVMAWHEAASKHLPRPEGKFWFDADNQPVMWCYQFTPDTDANQALMLLERVLADASRPAFSIAQHNDLPYQWRVRLGNQVGYNNNFCHAICRVVKAWREGQE